MAAWDVNRAKIFGRCEEKSGIASFDRLVEQVMSQESYLSVGLTRQKYISRLFSARCSPLLA